MSTLRIRYGLGGLGVLAALYGVFLVLSRQEGLARLESVGIWLVGGVVLHDAVLAPLVIGLAWLVRGTPTTWRRPAVVGLVVLGSLTLLAVPVLTGLGARADNPTLLDRPYGWSWLVTLVVVVALVVVAAVVGARRSSGARVETEVDGGADGDGPGGR